MSRNVRESRNCPHHHHHCHSLSHHGRFASSASDTRYGYDERQQLEKDAGGLNNFQEPFARW
ncbi:hypothetical protein E2C01_102833 [Portunus trituberculatus]|uniref:Uncharacterized protein n=1 Tax=Portunus trituberculatus TaxID=210409 RepID=A0A5B7KE92_PORTR|nr:hypothetical protein [Portunus trituberculatus]